MPGEVNIWATLPETTYGTVYYSRIYPPCLWFPELDIPPSFCRALGSFEETACQIVNPKIKAQATKLMTAGDPYCEFIFEEVD